MSFFPESKIGKAVSITFAMTVLFGLVYPVIILWIDAIQFKNGTDLIGKFKAEHLEDAQREFPGVVGFYRTTADRKFLGVLINNEIDKDRFILWVNKYNLGKVKIGFNKIKTEL